MNARATDAALGCRGLCFTYTGGDDQAVAVFDGLDAEFHYGRIALISGETGSGKSTLMHLLAGLYRPTRGQVVTVDGAVSRFTAPHRDRWRRKVGIVFQDLKLMTDLSVLENVMLAGVVRVRGWTDVLAGAREVLTQTDCSAFVESPVARLSGGQRQRVAVARAMMGAPRLLLLDEPTSFQDDRHTEMLLGVWARAAGQGACVVVCSHDPRLRQASSIHHHWRLRNGGLERRP